MSFNDGHQLHELPFREGLYRVRMIDTKWTPQVSKNDGGKVSWFVTDPEADPKALAALLAFQGATAISLGGLDDLECQFTGGQCRFYAANWAALLMGDAKERVADVRAFAKSSAEFAVAAISNITYDMRLPAAIAELVRVGLEPETRFGTPQRDAELQQLIGVAWHHSLVMPDCITQARNNAISYDDFINDITDWMALPGNKSIMHLSSVSQQLGKSLLARALDEPMLADDRLEFAFASFGAGRRMVDVLIAIAARNTSLLGEPEMPERFRAKVAERIQDMPIAHNTEEDAPGVPVMIEFPSQHEFEPGDREANWHVATDAEHRAFVDHWDAIAAVQGKRSSTSMRMS